MRLLSLLAVLASLLVASCGEDDIGDHCIDDRDCEVFCAQGKDFPGGLCTQGCSSNSDCPEYWVCVKTDGGICLETCPETAFCEAYYGKDWKCRDQDYLQGGGKVKVCLGD